MSSLASKSLLRLFSPKLVASEPKTVSPLLSSFTMSTPISFQRLTANPSSRHQPIKSQLQPQLQNLPENLRNIVTLFQSVPDNKLKYRQLLDYGTRLPPFPAHFRTDAHRVRGCVSQVWLRAYPDPADPSRVRFHADSDSQLTKGLAALLVFGLSGETPAAIAAVSPDDFVHLLGLNQSLTPSRNNGFLNMLKTMQNEAARIGGGGGGGEEPALQEEENGKVNSGSAAGDTSLVEEDKEEEDGVVEVNGKSAGGGRGRKERIRNRLERELSPVELQVEDISHLHAGHAGVRGTSGGETHFNVRVISEVFQDKSMVKRHRLVYGILREELESGLHALSIVAKTPSEA